MAQSLKNIKNRIRGIENARKVTSAMQMISVTKLNRIDKILYASRPYLEKMQQFFDHLVAAKDRDFSNPYFAPRPEKKNIVLCLITSDNGLCGIYNVNIINLAEDFMRQRKKSQVKLVIVGKKGFKYFSARGAKVINSYVGLNGKYSEKIKEEIADQLISLFISGEADEVYIAYTHYETALILKPRLIKFLSLERSAEKSIEYIFEPDLEKMLEDFLPHYLSLKIRLILLESFTSEHAARTVAMKMATENANGLLHKLVLLRNKVRQANITREILEIISSAEALKG